jgi:hypothetical protein
MAAVRRAAWAAALLCACAKQGAGGSQPDSVPSGACAARAQAPSLLPGVSTEQLKLEYWLARYSPAELDAPLLSPAEIDAYDHAVAYAGDAPYSRRDLLEPVSHSRIVHDVAERIAYVGERVRDGRYVDRQGKAVPDTALAAAHLAELSLQPELRVALETVPLRCGPLGHPLFERSDGGAAGGGASAVGVYDRNACSAARPQEVIQLLAPWPGGMWLARTSYALGFIDRDAAKLSPPIPEAMRAQFVRGPRARADRTLQLSGPDGRPRELAEHASAPLLPSGRVLLADAEGFHELPRGELVPARRALTRRALLTTAFRFMDSPYGFGDAGGGRDCSRLQMDVFDAFGIALPRHTGWQGQAGSYRVKVAGSSSADKLAALDLASANGIVLLTFPGHIMLHLGKTAAGTPMALHALGEYVRPCAGGRGETIVDVQRTVVSDLSLGAGSSRKSLLERIETLVVFGKPPAALAARAESHAFPPPAPPPAEACSDSVDARIFASPARPRRGEPLRLIATTSSTVQRPALWLFDAEGAPVPAARHTLGGPPFSVWVRVDEPSVGRYTAVFMDGETALGCKRVAVHDGELVKSSAPLGAPVWTPRFRWERDTLNLWSAFVEQLFDDPPDDERTWTNLHDLLRDPERNLLIDHYGQDDDARIQLVPDCADLPYALRGYFAWKLGLPFGYRQCSRGRPGVPPACGALQTNLMPREAEDDVEAFHLFINRKVRSGVHSATGRTHPEDPETDLYPVALERSALPPGTVYADPYGHVLILTKWFPQGRAATDYGILIGAEAQPDGTVGRRRFFRGSFLFDPSTKDAGAGFKHFRPLVHDRKLGALTPLDNASLAKSDVFARFSLAQYQGSKDDFYDRMDELINPAPLDPHVRLTSLLDALEESARRRVLAVDNGEQFMAEAGQRPMAMPSGHDIFETTGPWEDFATPSRDMRLLIAIDSVLDLPAQIERAPQRFRLDAGVTPKQAAETIRGELQRELGKRSFAYRKSDGAEQSLSLADVIARGTALELAYNPNDCVELRWGAPEGSQELATCRRRAPAEQQARMQRYRTWFHERTRPARGVH